MSKEKDGNAFYSQLQHVNQFLYSEKEFKQTTHVLTIKESIKQMHHTHMESFEHTSDFFKKAKARLRQKDEI